MKDNGTHLNLDVRKFQQCCVVEGTTVCEGDIIDELLVPTPTGDTYYLPFCGEEGCIQVKERIGAAADPHALMGLLSMEYVFICPRGEDYKVKFPVWELEKGEPVPEEEEEVEEITVLNYFASDDWEYSDEIDCWRNVEGDIVHIRHLSISELVDAVNILRDVNFKGVTQKIAWTKKLYLDPSRPRHIYPRVTLKIGANAASEKLQEFEAVAHVRGLI